jgi:hypothetical protein
MIRTSIVSIVSMAIVLATGCTQVTHIHLPDGRPGYLVRCPGWTGNWSKCLSRAGQICGSREYEMHYHDDVDGVLMIGCKAASTPVADTQ